MSKTSNIFPIDTWGPRSIFAQMQNFYVEKVKGLFLLLHKKNWDFMAAIVATFLIEPHVALRAAYLMQKGLDKEKFTNLNPKILSEEQLKCAPILLIHGDSSNSGLFGPMINLLSKEAPHQPIFTIDLNSPDGIVSV